MNFNNIFLLLLIKCDTNILLIEIKKNLKIIVEDKHNFFFLFLPSLGLLLTFDILKIQVLKL